jgi:hypothetical protein
MKKARRAPTSAAERHRRAEERLKKRAGSMEVGQTSPGDAQRLVDELKALYDLRRAAEARTEPNMAARQRPPCY